MSTYVDTSAFMKFVLDEPRSAALASYLDQSDEPLVSSILLETEARRAALRAGVPQDAVTRVLRAVTLNEMPRSLFHEAGALADPMLRTPDALHVASAVRLGVRQVLTYDDRMAAAAASVGLSVVAPA